MDYETVILLKVVWSVGVLESPVYLFFLYSDMRIVC